MDTLNRSAIVVRPKQPFLDWLHPVDPSSHGITLLDVGREPTIYLFPECDTDEELVDVLRIHLSHLPPLSVFSKAAEASTRVDRCSHPLPDRLYEFEKRVEPLFLAASVLRAMEQDVNTTAGSRLQDSQRGLCKVVREAELGRGQASVIVRLRATAVRC
jgi:hypothetical protein